MHSLLTDIDGCQKHADMKYDPDAPFCITEDDYPTWENPNKKCTPINGCGTDSSIPPRVFFYTFTLGVTFVMLNLFVGVVLDAFENSEEGDILGPEDMDKFTEAWAAFDPEADGWMKVDDLKQVRNNRGAASIRRTSPVAGLDFTISEAFTQVCLTCHFAPRSLSTTSLPQWASARRTQRPMRNS